MKISASILSIKDNLKENINLLSNLDIDYLHLDIMDGKFVKNKTWTYSKIKDIIPINKPTDVHLMVKDVYKYINDFRNLKPEIITFHYENNIDIFSTIKYVKNLDIKVGLSIKPDTQVDSITKYLPFIDLVLVMSVEPGEGGQTFIPSSLDKIDKLFEIREKYKYNYLIEVDGGINDSNIHLLNKADILVIGSYITNGDYEERIKNVKEKIYGWNIIRNWRKDDRGN